MRLESLKHFPFNHLHVNFKLFIYLALKTDKLPRVKECFLELLYVVLRIKLSLSKRLESRKLIRRLYKRLYRSGVTLSAFTAENKKYIIFIIFDTC